MARDFWYCVLPLVAGLLGCASRNPEHATYAGNQPNPAKSEAARAVRATLPRVPEGRMLAGTAVVPSKIGPLNVDVAVSSAAARVFVLAPPSACANGWLTRDQELSWVYVKAEKRVRLRFDGELDDLLAPGTGLTPYDVIRIMESEHRLKDVALDQALFTGTDAAVLAAAKKANPNVVGIINVLVEHGHEISCP